MDALRFVAWQAEEGEGQPAPPVTLLGDNDTVAGRPKDLKPPTTRLSASVVKPETDRISRGKSPRVCRSRPDRVGSAFGVYEDLTPRAALTVLSISLLHHRSSAAAAVRPASSLSEALVTRHFRDELAWRRAR
jgi:hypothetical protein